MNKMLKKIIVFILCVCLSGCSCSKDDNLIVYRSFYNADVSTFNYLVSNEYQEMVRIANLVDGLVEHDKYGNIVPSIASSWTSEIIDNKQIWTFYLKKDIYWSDSKGNKYAVVTANDFLTSLKYTLNYNSGSKNYDLPNYLIENAQNYYNGTMISNYTLEELNEIIEELTISDPYNKLSHYSKIKDVYEYCNASNDCTTDFNNVGVKALDDYTLQYTLSTPSPFFLSSLTHYSFLPANEKFINDIGFNNFGSNKDNLLYNGAYILNEYYHSSRMEYIKNPNYWDVSNVFIDKLVFTKALNYRASNYDRLSYESGNVTEFVLTMEDEEGWKKYVTGNNNEGSINNPVGDNTYVNTEINNFITYYFIYNQNRENYNYTTLSENESLITNKALQNNNFRKALTYGITKENYINNKSTMSLYSIVPEQFLYYGDKDYSEYFVERYSQQNNISKEKAKEKLSGDSFYDTEKSKYYLDLALEELDIDNEHLPIKIEYSYFFNEAQTVKDKLMIEKWNRDLNDCSNDTPCIFDKVEIVFNDAITSANDYAKAFYNQEFDITFIGLYPDFNDPLAYLKAFSTTGELAPYINHTNTEIDKKISSIDKLFLDSDLEQRYLLSSKLENYIIFEESLAVPICLEATLNQVVVSNLMPYERMKSNYGLSQFKFKYRKITNTKLSQSDIASLKQKYEDNKNDIG